MMVWSQMEMEMEMDGVYVHCAWRLEIIGMQWMRENAKNVLRLAVTQSDESTGGGAAESKTKRSSIN